MKSCRSVWKTLVVFSVAMGTIFFAYAQPLVHAESIATVIDDFNDENPTINLLGFWAGWGISGSCGIGEEDGALKIGYDYSEPSDFAWYSTNVWDDETYLNASSYQYLSFLIKGAQGGDDFYLQLQYGTPPGVQWERVTERYAEGDETMFADISKPALCDIDGDGDYDMFIGDSGGHIAFYRNDGAAARPDWTYVTNAYEDIRVGAYWLGANATPTFCDIDNDGDYDMFIGVTDFKIGAQNLEGRVVFYRNDGTPQSPIWTLVSKEYNNIDVEDNASPAFCDIDGDSDYDMFVSGRWGAINFYRNDGTPEEPSWEFVTDSYNSGDGSIPYLFPKPTFCDIDKDGDYDMFIGYYSGNIVYYRNDGTSTDAVWTLVDTSFNELTINNILSAPAFCDINNDSYPDLFIGRQDGYITFCKNHEYNLLGDSATIHSSDYFTVTDKWEAVNIPLSAFVDLNKERVRGMSMMFDNTLQSSEGTIYIDNITFTDSGLYLAPAVDFGSDTTAGIAPLIVNFADFSTGEITSWLWDFGDGTTSTEQNPGYTYNTAGTYAVSLIVTGPGGSDTETKTDYINVLPPPNNPPVFHPWEGWTIDEGQPYTWTILVADPDEDIFTLTAGTMPEGMQFDGYRTFTWQPGGRQAGEYSILLTAADEHGAASSLNMAITVRDAILSPAADFAALPAGGATPLTVNFTDTSTGDITSRVWDFGDGTTSTEQNPSHTYNDPGTYTVILTVTGPGGSDEEIKTDCITVTVPPAEIFVDDNYSSGGENDGHEWGVDAFNTIQNGITAVLSGGTVYVMPGLYKENIEITKPLTLISDAAYSREAEIRGVTANQATIYIHDTNGTESMVTMQGFTVTSTDSPNPGRGIFAVGVNELNIIDNLIKNNAGGIFIADTTAQFLIANNEIRDNTASQGGGIWVATVDAAHGIIDNNIIINNHIEYEGGGIYITDYEATGLLEIINNTIAYNTGSDRFFYGAGMQSALVDNLVLRNNIIYGNRRLDIPYLYLYENMFILGALDFTKVTYNCIEGLGSNLGSAETYGTGPEYGNNINVGPMFVDIASTPKDLHLQPASPCVDAGDPNDDYSQEPQPNGNRINMGAYGNTPEAESKPLPPLPVADFTASINTGIAPLTVQFTDLSVQEYGTITSWSWDLGNGVACIGQNPSIVYNLPGTYTVSLTVTGPGGTDTETKTDYITVNYPPPVASFTYWGGYEGDMPEVYFFTDTSTGNIADRLWDFGDGMTSTEQSPWHSYNIPGIFTVTLTVTGPEGSDAEVKENIITVYSNKGTLRGYIRNSTTQAPVAGAIVKLVPQIYNYPTPTYETIADSNGHYEIADIAKRVSTSGGGVFIPYTLQVSKDEYQYYQSEPNSIAFMYGAGGVVERNIALAPILPPVADFSAAPTRGEAPLAVQFTDASTGSITSWLWDFGDSGTSTEQNPSHTYYTDPGSRTVSLTVTGLGGSTTAAKTGFITVIPNPDGTVNIVGRVYDTATNLPVAGATILLESHSHVPRSCYYKTTTDENGNYEIRHVKIEAHSRNWDKCLKYRIYVSARGYKKYTSDKITFADGVSLVRHDVALKRGHTAKVRGRIYDAITHKLLGGVRVMLKSHYDDASSSCYYAAAADENGNYEIGNVDNEADSENGDQSLKCNISISAEGYEIYQSDEIAVAGGISSLSHDVELMPSAPAGGGAPPEEPVVYAATQAAPNGAVLAVVDDFDNADMYTNFLGLETGSGNFDTGDMVASYDVFGGNPGNPLNTTHQLSWDAALGNDSAPEDAFWYSFITNGESPAIPVADFSHLRLRIQLGADTGKRDIIGIDLQVNYPEGQPDEEGKPFKVYRAYQPLVNAEELDIISIGLYDFRDEYDSNVRFIDNLSENLAHLGAVAVAMTDHTDTYLTDTDGDEIDLNLDNHGTIFIDDVGFWNESNDMVTCMLVDDFEDVDPITNSLGYATHGLNTAEDGDEDFAGSRRHKIAWNGENQEWQSDVSNGGIDLMDIRSYTHLAYDAICQKTDITDLYEVELIIDVDGAAKTYSYGKAAGSERIHEEYIPLNRFRLKDPGQQGDGLLINDIDLGRVKEIRFNCGSTNARITAGQTSSGDDLNGVMWIDNVRFVTLASSPLYNYPPLLQTIDGQDVSYDFSWYPEVHRKIYGKSVNPDTEVIFDVMANDCDGNIVSIFVDLSPVPSAGFDTILDGPQAGGTFYWTPQQEDLGTHTLNFVTVDDDGAMDIQAFNIDVVPPPPPPVADFTSDITSGQAPIHVQFSDQSIGDIVSWSWDFGDGYTSAGKNPLNIYMSMAPDFYTVTLTVTDSLGRTASVTKNNYIKVLFSIYADFGSDTSKGVGKWDNSGADCYYITFGTGGGFTVTNWYPAEEKVSYTAQGGGATYYAATNLYQYLRYLNNMIATATYVLENNSDPVSRAKVQSAIDILNAEITRWHPIAGFTADPASGALPLTVQFADTSTSINTSWLWNFGDGTASTDQNPAHVYTSLGTYTVSLAVAGAGGEDTAEKIDCVTVVFGGLVQRAYSDKVAILPGDALNFHGEITEGDFDSYEWLCDGAELASGSIGPGQTAINTPIQTADYASLFTLGEHQIKLRAINHDLGVEVMSELFTVVIAGDTSAGIQTAINNASPGQTILIEPGAYLFTSNLNITKNITIKANGNVVFALGQYCIFIKDPLCYNNNEYYYRLFANLNNVTIDGITIIGYRGTSPQGAIQNYSGKLTLNNCRIIENEGIKVGAIYSCYQSTLCLYNTLVANNRNLPASSSAPYGFMFGPGVYCGVIYMGGYGNINITNSTIAYNKNLGQSFIIPGSSYYGGVPGDVTIEVKYGAVYHDFRGTTTITNSILWDNGIRSNGECVTPQDFFSRKGTSPVFNYCDTEALEYGAGCNGGMGTIPGEGLIHDDPEFIDALNRDYNITETSPCKGTGLNGADMGAKFILIEPPIASPSR